MKMQIKKDDRKEKEMNEEEERNERNKWEIFTNEK